MTAAEMILEAKAIRERLRNSPRAVPDKPIDLHPHRHSPPVDSAHPRPSKRIVLVVPKTNQIDHMFQIPHFIDIIHMLDEEKPETTKYFPVRDIQKATAKIFNLHVRDLRGPCRQRKTHVYPRCLAIYLGRKYTKRSSSQLGEDFQRDHTTILHAIWKIEHLVASECRKTIADLKVIEDALFDQHNSRFAVAAER